MANKRYKTSILHFGHLDELNEHLEAIPILYKGVGEIKVTPNKDNPTTQSDISFSYPSKIKTDDIDFTMHHMVSEKFNKYYWAAVEKGRKGNRGRKKKETN